MIPISEKFLYSTVRLEGIRSDSSTSVGTGFIYNDEENRIFVVTNKHVIDRVIDGYFYIHQESEKGGPDLSKNIRVNYTSKNFIGHPDPDVDVTVMNISGGLIELENRGYSPFFASIDPSLIPSIKEVEEFVTPLEEIIFIGYPSGLWDSVNNLPIARKGITATPYYVDFMGKKIFLIDASVFPGSSGSPVFIYYPGSFQDKNGRLYQGNRVSFLGIVAQVFQREEAGRLVATEIPTGQVHTPFVNQMIDLGIVYKANTIKETIIHFLSLNKLMV